MLKLGFDVDGVLADFSNAYANLLRKIDYYKLPEGDANGFINTWYWPTDQFGYTKEQDKSVWTSIMSDPNFWRNLNPYPETKEVLNIIADLWDVGNEIYFITNRPGTRTKLQTEEWLINFGTGLLPTVLVTEQKGLACRTLGLDFYLDDKIENCEDVKKTSTTNCLMLARGWNKQIEGVPRIPSVMDFFKAMKESADWVN